MEFIVNPVDDFDCKDHTLASSPVTCTAYELLVNAVPNVIANVNGVPVNDAAEPEPAFSMFKDAADTAPVTVN